MPPALSIAPARPDAATAPEAGAATSHDHGGHAHGHADAHPHGPGQAAPHAHAHEHPHGHPPEHAHGHKRSDAPIPVRLGPSLLRLSVATRLALAVALIVPLWVAVLLVVG